MSKILKRLISYVGKNTLKDLPSGWQSPVDKALKEIEEKNPQIKQAEIKGRPHKSTTDSSDPNEVVSIRLRDSDGRRVDTVHVHQDGTSKRK